MAKHRTETPPPVSDAYDVGYRKPPKATRFKKGHSGNPQGRPKGRRNLMTELRRALDETLTVVINGRRRTMTKREAICQQLANRSAAGDLAALRLLIPLMSQVDAPTGDSSSVDPGVDHALAEMLFKRLATLEGATDDKEEK